MFNREFKERFLNEEIEKGVTYIGGFNRLFGLSEGFEELFAKDLAKFSKEEIMMVFKSVAKTIRYTTAMTYNSLVGEYKNWNFRQGLITEKHKEICNVEDLKSMSYKKYVILTDDDILNLTQYGELDDADYNVAIFLKLFWEIDGQESVTDILRLRIQDVDVKKRTITIHRTESKRMSTKSNKSPKITPVTYTNISKWLISTIEEFAKTTELTFETGKKQGGVGKQGNYTILSAEENEGLIFRTTFSKRTVIGKPIDGVKFSNILYQFCQRHHEDIEVITPNDIIMSLALKHMVSERLTPAEMYTERRYFKNMLSSVYKDVFEEYAETKYPQE